MTFNNQTLSMVEKQIFLVLSFKKDDIKRHKCKTISKWEAYTPIHLHAAISHRGIWALRTLRRTHIRCSSLAALGSSVAFHQPWMGSFSPTIQWHFINLEWGLSPPDHSFLGTVAHYKVWKAATFKCAMWLENNMLLVSLTYSALWLVDRQ
jgi:hypothetical protein